MILSDMYIILLNYIIDGNNERDDGDSDRGL